MKPTTREALRLWVCLLSACFLWAVPAPAAAGCARPPGCPELIGLSSLGVQAVVDPALQGRLKLTSQGLESMVLTLLGQKIPRLKPLKGLRVPALSVSVDAHKVGGERLGVTLVTPRSAEEGKSVVVVISVRGFEERPASGENVLWKRKAIFAGPQMEIQAWIEDSLTAFAADWSRVNSAGRLKIQELLRVK